MNQSEHGSLRGSGPGFAFFQPDASFDEFYAGLFEGAAQGSQGWAVGRCLA